MNPVNSNGKVQLEHSATNGSSGQKGAVVIMALAIIYSLSRAGLSKSETGEGGAIFSEKEIYGLAALVSLAVLIAGGSCIKSKLKVTPHEDLDKADDAQDDKNQSKLLKAFTASEEKLAASSESVSVDNKAVSNEDSSSGEEIYVECDEHEKIANSSTNVVSQIEETVFEDWEIVSAQEKDSPQQTKSNINIVEDYFEDKE